MDIFDDNDLGKENFKRVLFENKHYATDQEINLLFNRFDRNKNCRISFQEFTEEIMPKNSLTH
jgi:Ca2+-binding EF-hand superfamily protein